MTQRNTVATIEVHNSFKNIFIALVEKRLNQADRSNDDVDYLDPNKREENSPQSINEKIARKDLRCSKRPESDALKSKRNQGYNNHSVEYYRAQDSALRRLQKHDVERSDLLEG